MYRYSFIMTMIAHHKSISMWFAKALSVTSWISIRFKFNLPTKIPKFNGFTFFVYQTRLQASTLSFPELISKLPQIGLRGLYRGSIPAILGQFSRSVLFHWFICKTFVGYEFKSYHLQPWFEDRNL